MKRYEWDTHLSVTWYNSVFKFIYILFNIIFQDDDAVELTHRMQEDDTEMETKDTMGMFLGRLKCMIIFGVFGYLTPSDDFLVIFYYRWFG